MSFRGNKNPAGLIDKTGIGMIFSAFSAQRFHGFQCFVKLFRLIVRVVFGKMGDHEIR